MPNGTRQNGVKSISLSKPLLILAVVLAVGQVCYWGAQAFASLWEISGNYPQQISVSAEGVFTLIPDVAVIKLGVKTEDMKVANVVKENNEKMNSILSEVKSLGVLDKDIQTLSYNLSQQYDYPEKGERVFRGYLLDQQIQIKVRDFAKIGDVLERATSLGANSIGDLQFTIDDPSAARAAALQDAIVKAKIKAARIADSSGLKMKKLINIYEDYSQYPSYSMATDMGGGEVMAKSLSSVAPTVQSGEQEIKVTVTLVYKAR